MQTNGNPSGELLQGGRLRKARKIEGLEQQRMIAEASGPFGTSGLAECDASKISGQENQAAELINIFNGCIIESLAKDPEQRRNAQDSSSLTAHLVSEGVSETLENEFRLALQPAASMQHGIHICPPRRFFRRFWRSLTKRAVRLHFFRQICED
jgi:hypothetical protein